MAEFCEALPSEKYLFELSIIASNPGLTFQQLNSLLPEACIACIQWCPRQAIEYWVLTGKWKHYQNPAIHLIDMIHKDF